MRGLDCTPAQLEAADRFISDHPLKGQRTPMNQQVQMPYEQLVRLVAWYGALRYRSGQNNSGGSLEAPGDYEAVTE